MKKNNKPKQKRHLTFEDDDFLFNEDQVKKEQKILGIKSEYLVFYIAIAIVGIIVVFVSALGAFNFFFTGGDNNTPSFANNQALLNDDNDDGSSLGIELLPNENYLTFTGMITNIDSSNRVFQIHNVNTRDNYRLFVQTGSELRGRFGQMLVFSEFNPGYIVNVSYNPDNNNIYRINIYDGNDYWENRFVTGLQVDPNGIIIYEGSIYVFNSELLVVNNGLPYSVENIYPLTMVTMRGIGNTVWYIEVERGFGTIQIVNNPAIINGSVEISREASAPIGSGANPLDQIVQVSEGAHTLVVHGDNISLYTRDVIVVNGQTTSVDLSDIELTSGYLNINVNDSAIVTVNGVQVNAQGPINLPFGTHRVIAQMQGYESFSEVIEFEEHNQNLNIALIRTQNQNQNNNQPSSDAVTRRVEIRSTPSGASVSIDGTHVGNTPIVTDVLQGAREVTLQLEGFTTTVAPIFVASHNLPFDFELQPLPTSPQPGLPVVDSATVTPPNVTPPHNTPLLPEAPATNIPPSVVSPPPVNQDDISFIPGPSSY